MSEPLRILLADDHAFLRRGVRETLEEAGHVVVAEAGDGLEALRLIREARPDVVVTDLSMPRLGGIELVSRLVAEAPNLAVLVLSTHPATELGLQVLEAGGAGYIEKREAPTRLPEAVARVGAGGRYVSPDLAEMLAARAITGAKPAAELSVREMQVVRAVAAGMPRPQIAEQLALSPSAVSTYRRRALQKLGLTTDAELGRYAAERGLVE